MNNIPTRGTVISFKGSKNKSNGTKSMIQMKAKINQRSKFNEKTSQQCQFDQICSTVPENMDLKQNGQEMYSFSLPVKNKINPIKKKPRKRKRKKFDKEDNCYPPVIIPSLIPQDTDKILPSTSSVMKSRGYVNEIVNGTVTQEIFQNKDYQGDGLKNMPDPSFNLSLSEESKERVQLTPVINKITNKNISISTDSLHRDNLQNVKEPIEPEIIILSSDNSEKTEENISKSENSSPSLLDSFITASETPILNNGNQFLTKNNERSFMCEEESLKLKLNHNIYKSSTSIHNEEFQKLIPSSFKPTVTSSQIELTKSQNPLNNKRTFQEASLSDNSSENSLNKGFINSSTSSSSGSSTTICLNKKGQKCLKLIILVLSEQYDLKPEKCLEVLHSNTYNFLTTLQELQSMDKAK